MNLIFALSLSLSLATILPQSVLQQLSLPVPSGEYLFGGTQVCNKNVFSSENSSASTGKKGLVYTKKLIFKGKRGKIHIYIYTKKH